MAATARNVDLSGVSEGGNFRPRKKPDGDYLAKIVKADDHQPKDKSKPLGWVLTIQVDGDARSTYPYYLSPEDKQLWKIRGICVAAGIKVPAGRIKFDPNRLVNKAIGIELEGDEYNGREKSAIADVFPTSEVGSAGEGAPDGDEVYDDEDIVDDGDDPIEDEPEEEPEEEVIPVKTRAKAGGTATRRRKAAPEPEPEDDEEEDEPEPEPAPVRRRRAAPAPEPEPEDDEDEPEPEPAPRRRRAAAPPAKAAAPRRRAKPAPVEEDDLDDLDLDELDD